MASAQGKHYVGIDRTFLAIHIKVLRELQKQNLTKICCASPMSVKTLKHQMELMRFQPIRGGLTNTL